MENKIIFSGKLSAAEQLFAGKYQKRNNQELSVYQQKLFNTALKGFSAFTTQEVARMSIQDRKTIMSCYGRTKQVINELKQAMCTNTLSVLFNKLFPAARGNSLPLLMQKVTDVRITSRVPLQVPKEVLIRRLIEKEILPKDFYKCAA